MRYQDESKIDILKNLKHKGSENAITSSPSRVGLFNAPVQALLTGGEYIWTNAAQTGNAIAVPCGIYMLRQEAHAGDQLDRGEDVLGSNWIISEGGALGWEIFPSNAMPAEKQIVNFFSFMDNYNGLSNLAQGAQPSVWDDVSYNIQPVVTIYTPESNLNDAVLGEKFGEFTLQDLYDMNSVLGTDNKTLEGFLSVLDGSANELANEVGPGWMRFSRWFTTRKWTTTDLQPTYVYSYWEGWNDSADEPNVAWVEGPSIFTAGQANYVFENFGAGKWLSTAAGKSVRIGDVNRFYPEPN